MFIAVLLTVGKICNLPKCPSLDKLIKNCGYIFSVILFSYKKNETLSFAVKRAETGYYVEWNNSETKRHILHVPPPMWELKLNWKT